MNTPIRIMTAVAALSLSATVSADWPGIYGPRRDNTSGQKGLLRSWPADGPTVLWTAPVNAGFGGPAVVAYPRGYSVTTSMDGQSWSQPVATGKGEGSRTTIAFAPVKAKFVRITQTASGEDMPNWSITNLRLFEAPSGRPTQ